MTREEINSIIDEVLKENETVFQMSVETFKKRMLEITSAAYTEKKSAAITENGLKIYQFMTDNKEAFSNAFSAKQIGEGLFMSSRSVSGAMRKLINDGYVEKMGANPVIYCLTDKPLEEE